MEIAKAGDKVFYTGETEYAVDSFTVELMNDLLIIDKEYIVKDVVDYAMTGVNHYSFKNVSYMYPCESFRIVDIVEYITRKYNLK